MKVVVYSEMDCEPLTVIDVHIDDLRRLHPSGDYLRFMPRMKALSWEDIKAMDNGIVRLTDIKTITVRFERFYRGRGRFEAPDQLMWVGWAHDDGLELRSTFLPGQLAELQWERV